MTAAAELSEGTRRVLLDVPLRGGYVEGGAASSVLGGPQAWLEGGAHLTPRLAAFSRAWATARDVGVLAGLRYEFGW